MYQGTQQPESGRAGLINIRVMRVHQGLAPQGQEKPMYDHKGQVRPPTGAAYQG